MTIGPAIRIIFGMVVISLSLIGSYLEFWYFGGALKKVIPSDRLRRILLSVLFGFGAGQILGGVWGAPLSGEDISLVSMASLFAGLLFGYYLVSNYEDIPDVIPLILGVLIIAPLSVMIGQIILENPSDPASWALIGILTLVTISMTVFSFIVALWALHSGEEYDD